MKHILLSSGIFGALSVVFGMLTCIAGLLIILLSKSRSAHRWALVGSFMPAILGITGSVVGYYLHGRQFLRIQTDAIMVKALIAELCSPTIIGVTATGLVYVFLGGLFLLKRPMTRKAL